MEESAVAARFGAFLILPEVSEGFSEGGQGLVQAVNPSPSASGAILGTNQRLGGWGRAGRWQQPRV